MMLKFVRMDRLLFDVIYVIDFINFNLKGFLDRNVGNSILPREIIRLECCIYLTEYFHI